MKLRNKKTGEIGFLSITWGLNDKILITDRNGVQLAKYNSLTELNEEWGDYEEPKEYWYYNTTKNGIEKITHLEDKEKDQEIGNYFHTKEEAEKAVEKLKAWKRLKDKGFKLDAVVDSFFCLDIYMKGKPYEEIKEDLKIIFRGEE